jgi:hypothetical protein
MLALLSKRLRLWLLLAVAVPLLAWLLGAVGERLEHRHGPTRLSRALCGIGGWLSRRARGPLAHRGEHGH